MEPTPAVTPEIIRPNLGCRSFDVDGVTYTRTDSLALGRHIILQRFQVELLYDTDIPGIQKTVQAAIEAFNANKSFDGVYQLGALRDKMDLIGSNRMRQAEITGLFYLAPGEDPTTYDHGAMLDKVYKQWRAVDRDFFTASAFHLLLHTESHYPPLPAAPGPKTPPPPSPAA